MNDFKLEMHQRVYRYSITIVNLIGKMPKNYQSEVLGKQVLRSGTSVAANLIEAKSASSKKDYINFYQHSLKSANETKLWLALIRDTNKEIRVEAEKIIEETIELANILASSILTMKNKK